MLRSLLICMLVLLSACAGQYPNQQPVGEFFPSVSGESLAGETIQLPADMSGSPTVLLLGYEQDSQFDIDRWLIGLDMTETKVDTYEVPTMQGLSARIFQPAIDDGMRAGIPETLWKGVITVYDGGKKIQQFTGNRNPNNARVVLLDADGRVRYFHDQGFSVPALNALRKSLGALRNAE